MRSDSTIHLQIKAKPGSVLEKAILKFIEDRKRMRKELQEAYDRQVNKQIKKPEQGGL